MDQWDELLQPWANYRTKKAFIDSSIPLQLNSYAQIEGRGGWLYQVEVPEGTNSLTIKLSGGAVDASSMDLDMMVSASQVPHWSFAQPPQCAPYAEGNDEECTFSDVEPGIYYITLDEYHTWAADITDVYLSACSGVDCSVTLPEPKNLVEIVNRPLPVEPLPPPEAQVLPISRCDLLTSYTRTSNSAAISVINTTDQPVSLYWIKKVKNMPPTIGSLVIG